MNPIADEDQAVTEAKVKPEATQYEKREFLDTIENEIEDNAEIKAEGEAKTEEAKPEETKVKEASENKHFKRPKIELPGLFETKSASRESVRRKIEEADQQVEEQIRSKTAEDQSAE
jgi:hypothetical protein